MKHQTAIIPVGGTEQHGPHGPLATDVPTWGLSFALAADLPFGLLATWFYLWRRDLGANSLAHSTALIVAMLKPVP